MDHKSVMSPGPNQAAAGPRKGYIKGVARAVAAIFVVGLAAAGGAVVFRSEILAAFLDSRLAAFGLADATYAIGEVGLRRVRITDIRTDGTLEADAVTIVYKPGELLRGRLRRVELHGARVDLTRPDEGAIGAIRRAMSGEDADDRAVLPRLPRIDIRDARLRAATAAGPIGVTIDAGIGPSVDGRISAGLRLAGRSPWGEASATLDGTVGPGETGQPVATIAGPVRAAVTTTGTAVSLAAPVTIELPIALRIAGTGAELRLTGPGTVSVPRLRARKLFRLTRPVAMVVRPMPEVMLRIEPGDDGGVRLAHAFRLDTEPLELRIERPAGAEVTVRARLGSLAMTGRLAQGTGYRGRVVVRAAEVTGRGPWGEASATLGGTVGLDDTGKPAADVAGRIRAAITKIGSAVKLAAPIAAELPITLRLAGPSAAVRLTGPGTVSVPRLRAPKQFRLTRPLAIVVRPMPEDLLRIEQDSDGGFSLAHAFRLETKPFELRTEGAKREQEKVRATLGSIAMTGRLTQGIGYQGRVAVPALRLTARGRSVAAKGTSVEVQLTGDFAFDKARFRVGTLRHVADPAILTPVAIDGSISRRRDRFDFAADLQGRGSPLRVKLSGSYRPDTRRGSVDARLRRLVFGPGRVQPGDIVPLLDVLSEVTGAVQATARLTWQAKAIDGRAGVRLEGLSIKTGTGAIASLTGAISLSSLTPPATPPGQTLHIDTVDVGAQFDDTTLRFALEPDGTIALERAETHLGPGRLWLEDERFDPRAKENRATIRVSGLGLQQLLDLLGVGDARATGRLDGRIPVRRVGERIAIDRVTLSARKGGVLQLRSKTLARTLGAGGKQVKLLLRALENFHYDWLRIGVSKALDGAARITLNTLGRNPEVQDGQPFQINVNLTTNVDRLVAAVLEAYRLSDRALGGIVGGVRSPR